MAAAITEAQVINKALLDRRSLLNANDTLDGRFSRAVMIKLLLTSWLLVRANTELRLERHVVVAQFLRQTG
jgi:hypothetical protein